MNPGRPYDSLYDGTYRVSGARDHYREQNRNAGVVIDRVPEFSNMFSKLPHHPSTTYRFKANEHIPQHVGREYVEPALTADQRVAVASKDAVSGSERHKYFKRPLLGTTSAVPAQLASHRAPQMGGGGYDDGDETMAMPQSRTIGVQSTYRESEAQTLAYTPDYVIPEDPTVKQRALMDKYHTDVPEVLTLQKLKFGQGLPVGLTELNHIDKLREKRAFEASLPPLHDVARLPQRKAMMEAWERNEWAEREDEILELQEERLELLAQAIETREANVETMAEERVERMRERELATRDQVFASIQKRRIKAVRQLTHARTKTDTTKIEKKTIVQKYGDFGSDVYAPMQRDGRFPESKPAGRELDPEPFVPRTLSSLYELENSVPARKLEAKIRGPKSTKRLDAAGRKEKAVSAHLEHINSLLADSKSQGGRGYGDCWPYPIASDDKLKKDEYHRAVVERPNTPLAPPVAQHAARDAAATLLQRLLRGRAVQNIMFEGKGKRLELINELRLQEAAEEREAQMLQQARTAAKTVGRPEAAPSTLPMPGMLQTQDAVLDDIIGESVMEVLAVISMDPGEEQDSAMVALVKKYAGVATGLGDEEEAATKIQSIFRGRLSRKDMKSMKNLQGEGAQMREQIIYTSEHEAAAVKIQARARGMLTRKSKTATTTKTSKTSKTSKTTTTTTSTEHKTSQAYSYSKQDEKKIVLLQAQSRGYLARKTAQRKKKEAESLPDLASFSKEDQEKIAKIQATGRGYIARKRVGAMRQPGDSDSAPASEVVPAEAPTAALPAAAKPEDGGAKAPAEQEEELPDLQSYTAEEQAQIAKIQSKTRLFNRKNRGKSAHAPSTSALPAEDVVAPPPRPITADTAGGALVGGGAAKDSSISMPPDSEAVSVPALSPALEAGDAPQPASDGDAAPDAAASSAATPAGAAATADDAATVSATDGATADAAAASQTAAPEASGADEVAAQEASTDPAASVDSAGVATAPVEDGTDAADGQEEAKAAGHAETPGVDAADAAASAPAVAPNAAGETAEATAGTAGAAAGAAPIADANATGADEPHSSAGGASLQATDGSATEETAPAFEAAARSDPIVSEAAAAEPGVGGITAVDGMISGEGAVEESAAAPDTSEVSAAAEDNALPDLSTFSADDQKKIVTMQAQSRGYIARKHISEQKTESSQSQHVVTSETKQSSSSATSTTTKVQHSSSSSHVETRESSVVQSSSTAMHSESTSSVVQSSTVVTSSSTHVATSESTTTSTDVETVVTQEAAE